MRLWRDGTPSSPATDPLVLDSGGNTNFQSYAQTTSYGFQFSNGTWLNDNISSIAGGGFGQNASSPDFVTPAEANWALCTPNPAIYAKCTDFKGAPRALEQFGGVSQSTPFTAGIAALMIQAYRNTHGGQTPSPALVKQILQSTANDLGIPDEEQGAGELDALKAVQEAMSVDGGTPTGHGLLFGPEAHAPSQPGRRTTRRVRDQHRRDTPRPSARTAGHSPDRVRRQAGREPRHERRRSSTSSVPGGRSLRRRSPSRPM